MRKIYLSPSILSADFANLKDDILTVERCGAEYLHFDVMDGHFVNNISFGVPVLKSISHIHNMINDVHIMIENPIKYVNKFLDAGADILTFHYEACNSEIEIQQIINLIHSKDKKAGISIKPNTDVRKVLPFINDLDLVLIMSVEPGFGGQEFLVNSIDKIKYLREYIDSNKIDTLIEVDGGINEETAKKVIEAGVDILVAGSFIFNGDIEDNMRKLR